jgi:hypothetical protein
VIPLCNGVLVDTQSVDPECTHWRGVLRASNDHEVQRFFLTRRVFPSKSSLLVFLRTPDVTQAVVRGIDSVVLNPALYKAVIRQRRQDFEQPDRRDSAVEGFVVERRYRRRRHRWWRIEVHGNAHSGIDRIGG